MFLAAPQHTPSIPLHLPLKISVQYNKVNGKKIHLNTLLMNLLKNFVNN
jgi:hypothetical protein